MSTHNDEDISGIERGDAVRLVDLRDYPGLDGQTGRVVRFDQLTQRYDVRLDETNVTKRVRGSNLRRLLTGCVVELQGLIAAYKLNGSIGECKDFDKQLQRYVVLLDGDVTKKVKPENVKVLTSYRNSRIVPTLQQIRSVRDNRASVSLSYLEQWQLCPMPCVLSIKHLTNWEDMRGRKEKDQYLAKKLCSASSLSKDFVDSNVFYVSYPRTQLNPDPLYMPDVQPETNSISDAESISGNVFDEDAPLLLEDRSSHKRKRSDRVIDGEKRSRTRDNDRVSRHGRGVSADNDKDTRPLSAALPLLASLGRWCEKSKDVSPDIRRRTYFMVPGHLTKFQSMKGPREAGANGIPTYIALCHAMVLVTDSSEDVDLTGPQRVEVLAAHAMNKTVYVLDSKKGLRKLPNKSSNGLLSDRIHRIVMHKPIDGLVDETDGSGDKIREFTEALDPNGDVKWGKKAHKGYSI
ncbi:hypothetical protein Pmar_PMAR023633 [Perkinsus marinus ATCC 50983]|uniref:Uncharacterized protein n=1 Tax=Perkinsus marinus (strain ATCC 50983 / TXsc) TaxID=423536 RepID=C5KCV8_PERM5|nr:hypothetical protein Pmar_PMAR023633 [Perkinsus marinus ATCC 50983]EER17707.1 hypothetical protein Pmar_PMAR023633 [Perkinsus marinus ATCC 50983]|eukprot:XP_002785911.1 hypothetical protein Pmar_PMAR023633 [Perkinsus marinus ATCC 50983]